MENRNDGNAVEGELKEDTPRPANQQPSSAASSLAQGPFPQSPSRAVSEPKNIAEASITPASPKQPKAPKPQPANPAEDAKKSSTREAQAKLLSEQLINFHEKLMGKIDRHFDEAKANIDKRVEKTLAEQHKKLEPHLIESFSRQLREQLTPQLQKFIDVYSNKYSATVNKAFGAFTARQEAEAAGVGEYAKLLGEAIKANISTARKLEEGLARAMAEGGKPSAEGLAAEAREDELLEKVLAQQTRIMASFQQLTDRVRVLEQPAPVAAVAPPKPGDAPYEQSVRYVPVPAGYAQAYYPGSDKLGYAVHPSHAMSGRPLEPMPGYMPGAFYRGAERRTSATYAQPEFGPVYIPVPVGYSPYGEGAQLPPQ